MNEIASETNDYEKYNIIMPILWATFEDTSGRGWKQMFKVLTLLEFLIKNGSERVIDACRDKIYKLRQLENFNYYEGSVDKGQGVREKAKQVVELLGDNGLIRSEREKARALRNKFVGISNDGGGYGGSYGGSSGSYGGSSGSYGGSSGSSYGGSSSQYGGYGNDSYSSNNSGYRDSGNSGSGGGGGRYDDYNGNRSRSGFGNDSFSSTQGGGAYDTSRPSRYSDEAPAPVDDYSSKSDDFEDNSFGSKSKPSSKSSKSKSSSSDAAAPVATGGKLKVSIKKAGATKQPEPEIDLFNTNDDPFTGGATASASSTFDPFGSAPAAASDPFGSSSAFPVTSPAPSNNVFPSTPQGFDPFAAAPMPQQQQQNQSFNAFSSPMQQPVQTQQWPQQAITQAQQWPQQQQPNAFNAFSPPTNPGMAQMQSPQANYNNFGNNNMMAQSAPVSVKSESNDFGDFETAKSKATAPANSKWGDLGKLVDLGGISKNEDLKSKQAAEQAATQSYANSSFSGLDGFSKTGMGMASSRPVSTMPTQPMGMAMKPQMQPAMMGQPGMNMMGQPGMNMMGQQGMMGQPQGYNMMGQQPGMMGMPQGYNPSMMGQPMNNGFGGMGGNQGF